MTKEATFLSLEARWRSSRDPICRGVMFLTPLVLAITASFQGPVLLFCGWCGDCSAGGATGEGYRPKDVAVCPGMKQRILPFRGSMLLTIFDAPAVPQTCE